MVYTKALYRFTIKKKKITNNSTKTKSQLKASLKREVFNLDLDLVVFRSIEMLSGRIVFLSISLVLFYSHTPSIGIFFRNNCI